MGHIDKDEELVCPLCGGEVLWMPVSRIYVCEHCKQSYSEGNGVYLRKERKATVEKSSAVSNAAKLREALAPFPSLCDWLVVNASKLGIPDMVAKLRKRGDKARAALSAPPRNCDKYATADEALKAQEQMFNDSNFANGECKLGCPECDNPRVGCKIAWLFAPATEKEGGEK